MGGVVTPALAGAVAREGGLGMLAGTAQPADAIAANLRAAFEAGGPGARIGVNFLMPFVDRDIVERVAAQASVVEFFYGDPDMALVDITHQAKSLAAWQVGSVAEALAATDAGCDFVIAQGIEGGGHVRGTTELLPLLEAVRAVVTVPLVAAGGLGTARDVAAAMDAGADAVRIGTRFLATSEADVHPVYLEALLRSNADDTVITEAFSMFWPHAPHRVLRSCIEASDADPAARPPFTATRNFDGDVAASAMYAGTSVGAVTKVESAAEVVRDLLPR